MNNKIYIDKDYSHVHEVPSMVSFETMLGLFFIDGSNLYHNILASGMNPSRVNIVALISSIARKLDVLNYKIIYFNSIPSILDGQSIYFNHLKFLDGLRRQGIEVHTRKLQRLSNSEKVSMVNKELNCLGLCENCRPIIESHYRNYIGDISLKEKGIDMMVAIEMIRHGIISKDCSRIILLSGDADFIPCMDLLNMRNVEVMSACTAKGYSYELRNKHKWHIIDKQELRYAMT
jgi:uncharacterized LabA/DUF88 family protein